MVKKAILLQLIGAGDKILENGSKLRGRVNILMVGDPSQGKSEIMRFAQHIAPHGVSTNGRGSSGPGLTAAIVRDEESGDLVMLPGAAVIASGGLLALGLINLKITYFPLLLII